MKAFDALKQLYIMGGGQGDIDAIQENKFANMHSVIYGEGINVELPSDFEDVVDSLIEGGAKEVYLPKLKITNNLPFKISVGQYAVKNTDDKVTVGEGNIITIKMHQSQMVYCTSDDDGLPYGMMRINPESSVVDFNLQFVNGVGKLYSSGHEYAFSYRADNEDFEVIAEMTDE